jgi:hypothetical protein
MSLEALSVFAVLFSANQLFTLWLVAMGVVALVVISLAGIIVPAWAGLHTARIEAALKQQMLERGLSADEIVRVLNRPDRDLGSVDAPCASEAVVECDGEWSPALILRREGERYFVHHVGQDMSDNEWVDVDRLRFPAASKDRAGSPWDWTASTGGSDVSRWCASRSKPAPVDAEL